MVVPVVWAALSLLFLLFFVVPGDPVDLLAGERAVNATTRTNIEEKLGLDKPWYVQYGNYWNRLAHGDLGDSYRNNRPVLDVLKEKAPASIRLAIWAVILEVLLGITAGLISAVKRYSFVDALTTVSTTMLIAVPVFVLGYVLLYMLGVYTNQHHLPHAFHFPTGSIGPDHWLLFFIPWGGEWRYLLLPAVTLASASTALVARMMRTTMLEVQRADYMRTARAKGLMERTVILKHGLKNAMIPVVTLIGLDLASLIGSAILTETVFNWPGMGSTLAQAIQFLDAPIVLGFTLVFVVAYVLINLAVDVSYAFFDPRIRYGSEGS
jgi:ABC-type dipeptide/oligopeptide/nickel transport system permease component